MAEMIMAFTPLVFLIVYALKTRKMAESMILATLLAMVLLHRQHFLTGTIDAMYATLANASYQFALCVIIGFGGMITLLQASGAPLAERTNVKRGHMANAMCPFFTAPYARPRSAGSPCGCPPAAAGPPR